MYGFPDRNMKWKVFPHYFYESCTFPPFLGQLVNFGELTVVFACLVEDLGTHRPSLCMVSRVWYWREKDLSCDRRKFWSQTSDNMDRWKSRGGKSQRIEEQKREGHRGERVRRKKMQVREKVAKSRNEPKVAGAEPCGQMRDKKLHAVVARSTFRSQNAQTHHSGSTFGSWDVEKVHAVVARSTFRSQNVQNTLFREHFWKLRCRKSARRCGANTFRSQNVQSTPGSEHFMEVEMSKKCTPLWREAHFQVRIYKTPHFWITLDVQMSFRVAGARDWAPCQKWEKCEGFLACPKTVAGVGHLKRICKDAFSVAGAVQETCSSEMLGGPGADFLRGVAFWSIRSSVLGRWFCVTGAALRMTWHHFFVAGAILQRHGLEKSQKALVPGRQLCTQLSILLKEVSQICFVFDVANFKNWGEVSQNCCCQVPKLRKTRRTASFSSLQIDR